MTHHRSRLTPYDRHTAANDTITAHNTGCTTSTRANSRNPPHHATHPPTTSPRTATTPPHTPPSRAANTGDDRQQLHPHPHPLRTLTREHEHRTRTRTTPHPSPRPPTAHRPPAPPARRPAPHDQRPPPPHGARTPTASTPATSPRPARRRPVTRPTSRRAAAPAPADPPSDRPDSTHGTDTTRRRQAPPPERRPRRPRPGACSRIDVGVGAADAERRDTAPGAAGPSPATARASVSSRTAPADQSTCGDGSSTCRRLRQHAVPHRQHHLDHARHTGRGLGVPDVRLHRPQPQRPVRRPVLAVRRQQRLRLDRVTQRRPGAVRLHHVHVGRRQPRRSPAPAGSPAAATDRSARSARCDAPSWFTARAAHHRQHLVAVAPRVRQPLQQQHADALGPAGAVGGRRERLAPAVRRQAALPAELDERRRASPSRSTPPASASVALAGAQRLRGQVQRHQRRRAGGVHGHRRALQAERVGDPAGGDAAGAAGDRRSPRARRAPRVELARVVVRTSRRRRRRSRCPRSGRRVDARRARAPPRRSPAAAAAAGPSPAPRAARCRRTPASNSPASCRKPPSPHVARAGAVRVGVVQRVEVPAAVGGEAGDRVARRRRPARHRSSGEPTPPGKRQAIPTIAIGSRSRCLDVTQLAERLTQVGGRAPEVVPRVSRRPPCWHQPCREAPSWSAESWPRMPLSPSSTSKSSSSVARSRSSLSHNRRGYRAVLLLGRLAYEFLQPRRRSPSAAPGR